MLYLRLWVRAVNTDCCKLRLPRKPTGDAYKVTTNFNYTQYKTTDFIMLIWYCRQNFLGNGILEMTEIQCETIVFTFDEGIRKKAYLI